MLISKLRPRALDTLATANPGPLSTFWLFLRTPALDRGIYWGLVITLLLPAVASLLGFNFGFTGSFLTGLAVSALFFVWTMVLSIAVGLGTRAFLEAEAARRLQNPLSLFITGGGLLVLAHFFAALSFSWFGLLVAVAVLYGVTDWALQETCIGGQCELPAPKK